MTAGNKEIFSNWKNHIIEWEKSGLTRAECCKIEELKTSTFDYWRRKIKYANNKSKAGLVRITPQKQIDIINNIELQFPQGFILKIPESVKPDNLGNIINVLKETFK